MPILRRQDGVAFVLQPYRELLNYKKPALLKKEIRLLAQNNGAYVRLFRQPDNRLDCAFSREAGYLLGEAIWHYFGRPEDLIYCEECPDGDHIILVVIRNNKVFIDDKLQKHKAIEELAGLMTEEDGFIIYIYGDVPLAEVAEEGKFIFEKNFVRSFTELEEPLFNQLPLNNSLQLMPINEALADQYFSDNHSYKSAIIMFIVLIGIIFITWMYNNNQHISLSHNKPNSEEMAEQSILQNYLSSPTAGAELIALSNKLNLVYAMPGWVAERVQLNNHSLIFMAHSLGGTPSELRSWTDAQHLNFSLTPDGAMLTASLELNPRPTETEQKSIQQVQSDVIERMMLIVPTKTVVLGDIKQYSKFTTENITINLTNISPLVLQLMGQGFADLPLNIVSADFTLTTGLLSGQIQLTILGG